jgi:hypothetical protein
VNSDFRPTGIAVVDTTDGSTKALTPDLVGLNGKVTAILVDQLSAYVALEPQFTYQLGGSARAIVVRLSTPDGTVDKFYSVLGTSAPNSFDYASIRCMRRSSAGARDRGPVRHRRRAEAGGGRGDGPCHRAAAQLGSTPRRGRAVPHGAHRQRHRAHEPRHLHRRLFHARGRRAAELGRGDRFGRSPWPGRSLRTWGPWPRPPWARRTRSRSTRTGSWWAGSSAPSPGAAHTGLAQVDTVTGAPVAGWTCNVGGNVQCMLVRGTTVFVGGGISRWAASRASNIGALNGSTGAVLAWNPNVAGVSVDALAASNDTVYIAGDYSQVSSQSRLCLAAVNATTARSRLGAAGVRPRAHDGDRRRLAHRRRRVLVPRRPAEDYLGRLDRATGALGSGLPVPDDLVFTLARGSGPLHIGGRIREAGREPVRGPRPRGRCG